MCEKMDNAIEAAKQCGDAEHFCKGADIAKTVALCVQDMQRQIDRLISKVDSIAAAECRDHEQLERCRKLLSDSAGTEFERGI